jgi:hypothetical protein
MAERWLLDHQRIGLDDEVDHGSCRKQDNSQV